MSERIFRRNVQGDLEEIPARDPLRRYRYRIERLTPESALEPIYLEFTAAEEAAQSAEESAPPPPFAGLGRCVVTRAVQSIPHATPTLLSFDVVEIDRGDYFRPANPDRLTIGPRQAGLFVIQLEVRFDEASATAGGGTPNAGARVIRAQLGGQPLRSPGQPAIAQGDTEMALSIEREVAAAALLRFGVLQRSGGAMNVEARASLRRLGVQE